MKQDSGFGKLQAADFIKGLIVAVLGAVASLISTSIEAGSLSFDWAAMGKIALLTGISYIVKNLFTNNAGEFAKKDT